MKLLSWNVNGIRAVSKNGFLDWFENQNADVYCLQEIKAKKEQLEETLIHPQKFHSFWHSAEKAGYSGVSIYSKKEPLSVEYGLGSPEFDSEGRVLILEYKDFYLINAYFPNSQRDHARLDYKISFCNQFEKRIHQLREKGKSVLMCGDFNIAHQEIDLKNPKANMDNAGFLPEERSWLTHFIDTGFVDTFREFEKGPDHYTWWSYRPGIRARNIGWRLDYFFIDQSSKDRLKKVIHQPDVKGSDHCPVLLELR